ncbi:MAG: type VI secretion system tube protein Hcp [Chloroflexi bacterium]|nr:type VI secretion system tube protein Hcp [Chloroflexota bacterium]
MRLNQWLPAVLAMPLFFNLSPRAQAGIYVSIEGVTPMSKEGARAGHAGEIPAVSYEYGIEVTSDASTGRNSSKSVNNPLQITMERSTSTPRLFQALNYRETLRRVDIRITGGDSLEESVIHTIRLTGAEVDGIEFIAPGVGADNVPAKKELVKVVFRYEKMEFDQGSTPPRPPGVPLVRATIDGNTIPALGITYRLTAQRDQVSGQETGKSEHRLLMISTLWSAASDQIYQSAKINELRKSIDLDLIAPKQRIHLGNAAVAKMVRRMDDHNQETDDIWFGYETIEFTNMTD